MSLGCILELGNQERKVREIAMAEHYFSEKPSSIGRKEIISDIIRGVPVEFIAEPGVFSKSRVDPGTKLLLETMIIPKEGYVLDLGAGYGVIGITLAKINPKLIVYMVEINRRAVKLCKLNAKRNGVENRVVILQGNLYDPLPKNLRFKTIVSNPPFSAGSEIIEKIVEGAYSRLEGHGLLQLVAYKGADMLKKRMREIFGNVEVLASKKGYKVLMSEKTI